MQQEMRVLLKVSNKMRRAAHKPGDTGHHLKVVASDVIQEQAAVGSTQQHVLPLPSARTKSLQELSARDMHVAAHVDAVLYSLAKLCEDTSYGEDGGLDDIQAGVERLAKRLETEGQSLADLSEKIAAAG